MSELDNVQAWSGRPGHYEVWYLTLSDPGSGTGYWIRYTLHAPSDGGEPEGRLWFARFDAARPDRVFGLNRAVRIAEHAARTDPFELRFGDAVFRSGEATGALEGEGHTVRWELQFPVGDPTYRMLPAPLYRGGLAPSKPLVPNPDARFTGVVEVDGEAVPLADAPGQQGHVHGTRHAERWAWAHAGGFPDAPGAVLEALCAQGRRGPVLTPHVSFVGVRHDGRWLRFRAASRRRPWGLGMWRVNLANRRHRLVGSIRAAPEHLLQTRYEDPDGTPRYCHNSEVSSCDLTLLERRAGAFEEVAVLSSDGGVHAEWGGRTPAPGVDATHVRVDAPR